MRPSPGEEKEAILGEQELDQDQDGQETMVEISERNRESQEKFFPSDHITTMKGNFDYSGAYVGRSAATKDNHELKTVDML